MRKWGNEMRLVQGSWRQNNLEQPPSQQVESGLAGRSNTKDFYFVVLFSQSPGTPAN